MREMLLALAFLQADGSYPPIEIPPEANPAWVTYRKCVDSDFRKRMLSVHNPSEARQAWSGSVADCRNVRAQQLERALKVKVDRRIYGNRAASSVIIRRAFDRYDNEFNMTWNNGPTAGSAPKSEHR